MHPTDEAITKAMENAPSQVREYIEDGKLSDTIVDIASSYGLHMDVIGDLAELSRNLLLGLTSPTEVVGELVLSGIDADTARRLLLDLNQKIFIPMRDRIRNPEAVMVEEEEIIPNTSYSQSSTSSPVAPPTPAPIPSPLPTPAAYVPPVTPPQTSPAYTPPVAAPATAAPVMPATAAVEHPQMRTMATDMQAAKEHEPVRPFYMEHHAPTVAPPPAPAPRPVAAPQAPATVPEPPHIAPVRAIPPPPSNLPGAPVVHEYSVDPYREPTE